MTIEATDGSGGQTVGLMPPDIAAICSTIVGMDIPPDANLFDIGLTSMHLLRLIAALSRASGTKLRYADVLDHPTCAQLAAHLAARTGSS